MNSAVVKSLEDFQPAEPACGAELVGQRLWDLLVSIERFSENWVVHGIPKTHSFGRLPDEEEIRAWAVPRSTGYWLNCLIRLTGAKTVLEIGTSLGYSTLWMASALANNGGHIYTCELFDQKTQLARQHFAKSGLRNITLLTGDAVDTTKTWDKRIDILFLDADPENYPAYWSALKPWLHKESVIIMDNAVDHRTVTEPFISDMSQEPEWVSWVMPFDHGLLFAKRK
jgi:predicted O-methyltransferase YrrM